MAKASSEFDAAICRVFGNRKPGIELPCIEIVEAVVRLMAKEMCGE